MDGGVPWLSLGTKIIYIFKKAYVSIASHINSNSDKDFLTMRLFINMN